MYFNIYSPINCLLPYLAKLSKQVSIFLCFHINNNSKYSDNQNTRYINTNNRSWSLRPGKGHDFEFWFPRLASPPHWEDLSNTIFLFKFYSTFTFIPWKVRLSKYQVSILYFHLNNNMIWNILTRKTGLPGKSVTYFSSVSEVGVWDSGFWMVTLQDIQPL